MRIACSCALFLVACTATSHNVRAEDPPLAEKYLVQGKLAEGEAACIDALKANPKDAQLRFGLGTIQFVRAVERLVQSFHRYGVRSDVTGGWVPFVRLPIPPNKDPQPIRYEDARAIFQALNDDLRKAEQTLAMVDDPGVKLPLHFGMIHLDLDGDGEATQNEVLWRLYNRLNNQAQISSDDAKLFLITFDRGDVAWLRGYCHLLMAIGEFYLGYDSKLLFERAAHLIYAQPETPFNFLRGDRDKDDQNSIGFFSDVIAAIHSVRMPVAEPKRLGAALDHLKAMVALSRETWKSITAETDDDHEWIPNPKQTGIIPGIKITEEMVKGWTTFLDEADDLLEGRKLVPFWRNAGGRGVNLKRVFTEPHEFDLVFWVQGTAAFPYLEEGNVTKPETWQRLQRIFRGEFIGFAIWFN